MKKNLYIIAAALCMAACQKEVSEVQPVTPAAPERATVTVPFTVTIQTPPEAATRADDRINRPVLNNLYIAIFGENGGVLQQLVPARQTTEFAPGEYGYNNQANFEAELPLYDDECHLHFIGNLTEDISSLLFDYEKELMDDMAVQITTATDGQGHTTITDAPVAFWQKVILEDGIKSKPGEGGKLEIADETKAQLNDIALVRNYAKITVTADADAEFEILSYALINVPVQGTFAPYHPTTYFNNYYMNIGEHCSGANTDNFVTKLRESKYPGYMGNNTAIFKGNPGYGSAKHYTDPDNGLYMYERTLPTGSGEQTGVIIELKWKNTASGENASLAGKTYFYKIEVLNHEGEYMPIFRNVYYNINLTQLTGAGYIVDANHSASSAFDKAFAGPYFGNVSSSIETATLNTINDNIHQIYVNQMDYLSVSGGETVDLYFQFWLDKNDAPSTNPANYHLEKVDVDPYGEAIASYTNPTLVTDTNDPFYGYMHVAVTLNNKDSEGNTLREKLRIQGMDGTMGSLWRDVVFTVMEIQHFTGTTKMTKSGNDVTVNIGLPEDLPYSMFPIQVKIESEYNNISTNRADLPVGYGESAFDTKASTFYFIKTIQYKDYVDTSTGEYVYTTEFPCTFKNLDPSKTLTVKLTETQGHFESKTLTAN